jgi:hypothetical protein
MVFSALAALLLGPAVRSASAADGNVRVLEDTPVSPAADIPADVRKECTGLGDELPRAVMRANPRVTMVRTPGELQEKTGRYLQIEIIQVKARVAGALTGPKKMTVRGALIDDGKQVADFEAERGAMEAAGTCRTLQKAEKELGADIGTWLMHPRPHSRLGDR